MPPVITPELARLPGVPDDILLLTGPLMLGYCFNWGLFGVLCMQLYMYFLGFPGDMDMVKVLVYGLFIVETVQTALTTHNAWHFLVSGWGDPDALISPGWSWIAVPLLSGIVSMTVQIFFAWRIWKISGSFWISGFIVLVALMQGIAACVSGIWFEIIDNVTKIASLDAPATVWLAGSAIADVLIAIAMVYLLRKSNTGFSDTNILIRRLIRMTVETGAVTAVCATLELIMYLKWKENNLHMIPALALSKLYTNTLVATLNSRNPQYRTSRAGETETSDARMGGTTGGGLHFRSTMRSGLASTQDQAHTKVQITTNTHVHSGGADDIAMNDVRHPGSDMKSHHVDFAEEEFDEADDVSLGKVNADSLDVEASNGQNGAVRRFYERRTTDDHDHHRGL